MDKDKGSPGTRQCKDCWGQRPDIRTLDSWHSVILEEVDLNRDLAGGLRKKAQEEASY